MKFLDRYSARIIEYKDYGHYLGIDDRYWLSIIEVKYPWWRFKKPTYRIELIVNRGNEFTSRSDAVVTARDILCALHDLIRREP